ncbi:MAG TPA: TIGR03435 family protein [Vicinamibacterales bacterium]|jgi:uncharacterized protein (TIGR03435 family)
MSRSDGKLGPKMSKTTDDCEAISAQRAAASRARGPDAVFTPPPPTERPICTASAMTSAQGSNGGFVLLYRSGGQQLDVLARTLSGFLERQVVNRTGLTGLYDYDLEFSPPRWLATAPAVGATPAAPIDDGPTIFDAMKQLGLKLDSTRGPVEYLVIDSIEHPTED